MKCRAASFIPLALVVAGSLTTGYLLRPVVIEHHLNNTPFDLREIYQAGLLAGVAGASGAALGIAIYPGQRRRIHQAVIRELEAQTGRADLTGEQRAALAYVAQDLREIDSK